MHGRRTRGQRPSRSLDLGTVLALLAWVGLASCGAAGGALGGGIGASDGGTVPTLPTTGDDVGSGLDPNSVVDPNDAGQGDSPADTNAAVRAPGDLSVVTMVSGIHCFDLHTLPDDHTVGMYGCNMGATQTLVYDANGQLAFLQDPNYCVAASLSPSQKNSGTVVVRTCANDANQRWTLRGNSMVHAATGLCAQMGLNQFKAADGIPFDEILLLPCKTGVADQQWFFGSQLQAKRDWAAKDALSTVTQKCSPIVTLGNYNASDPGTLRFVNRYGGSQQLLLAVSQYIQNVCAQMYLRGAEVPVVRQVTVNFWPGAQGQWAPVDRTGLAGNINYNTAFWASVDESQQTFASRTDGALHHDLTEVFDVWYYKPNGIIDGYADYITYRAGYLTAAVKAKGGNWTDGAERTAFFLLWLDDVYASKARGSRFTDVMQAQTRAQLAATPGDPNWFLPWVKSYTGESMDALWTKYQASF